jgi:hypothetical protein
MEICVSMMLVFIRPPRKGSAFGTDPFLGPVKRTFAGQPPAFLYLSTKESLPRHGGKRTWQMAETGRARDRAAWRHRQARCAIFLYSAYFLYRNTKEMSRIYHCWTRSDASIYIRSLTTIWPYLRPRRCWRCHSFNFLFQRPPGGTRNLHMEGVRGCCGETLRCRLGADLVSAPGSYLRKEGPSGRSAPFAWLHARCLISL